MLDLWQAFRIERSIKAPSSSVGWVALPDFIQRVPSCCLDQHHLCPTRDKKSFKVVVVGCRFDGFGFVGWGFLFVGVFWWGDGRERAVWDILSSAVSPVTSGSKNPTLIVVWEEESFSIKVNEKDAHESHLISIKKRKYCEIWRLSCSLNPFKIGI